MQGVIVQSMSLQKCIFEVGKAKVWLNIQSYLKQNVDV